MAISSRWGVWSRSLNVVALDSRVRFFLLAFGFKVLSFLLGGFMFTPPEATNTGTSFNRGSGGGARGCICAYRGGTFPTANDASVCVSLIALKWQLVFANRNQAKTFPPNFQTRQTRACRPHAALGRQPPALKCPGGCSATAQVVQSSHTPNTRALPQTLALSAGCSTRRC